MRILISSESISAVHKNLADGSARASDSDCRRVGDIAGRKQDDVLAKRSKTGRPWQSSRYRIDVFRIVCAGKQRQKIEKRIGWLVGSVKVGIATSVYGMGNLPRVSCVIVLATSDACFRKMRWMNR